MTIDEHDVRERFTSLAAGVTFRADPARLVAEGKRLVQRQRRRRVGAAIGSGGALVVALIVLGATILPSGDRPSPTSPTPSPPASGSTHLAPLADVAATPHGWAPVAYRDAQISVPAGWFLENSGITCGQHDAGRVFVARSTHLPTSMGCGTADAVVTVRAAATAAIPHATSVTVNGIAVEVGWTKHRGATTWMERGLGLDITATGTHAREVLRTLTHSPLSVVVGSSDLPAPSNWRHVTFGGLAFAAPAGWRRQHTALWGAGCGGMLARVVELSTARRIAAYRCPAPSADAREQAGRPGLVVGAGPVIANDRHARSCRDRNQLRICLLRSPQTLTVFVHLQGRSRPVEVEIGVFGSGLTSATIFDSIRPAQ